MARNLAFFMARAVDDAGAGVSIHKYLRFQDHGRADRHPIDVIGGGRSTA